MLPLVRVALTFRTETWVKLGEFLPTERHSASSIELMVTT